MDIRSVRQKFPQYNDLSDEQLARALHQRYYADMPYEDFAQRAGLGGKTGLGAALARGAESTLSSARTGLSALIDPNAAAAAGLERGEDIDRRYASQVGWDKIKQAYEERGLLPAAGEVVRQVPYALAEQAPNIAATMGGAKIGAMAGSPFGPVGAGIGAVAGAVAPSLVQQFGSNVERQAAEQQRAGQAVDVSRGAAAAAAAPQAALDVAATFIPMGRTLVGKVLGPNVAKALGTASAEKLAQETLARTLLRGGATSIAAEVPTEIVQQMLERAQAGLPLTSADALAEYGEAGYQAALISPIGAVGRSVDKGAARTEIAGKEAQARAARAQEAAAAQAREEEAAQARYQDPAYAQQVEQEYQAAEARAAELRAALKVPKDAPMADKLAAKEAGEQLKEFIENELKPKAAEYNRVKPLLAQMAVERGAPEPGVPAGQLFAAPVPEAPEVDLFGQPVTREAARPIPSVQQVTEQYGEIRRQLKNLEDAKEAQRAAVAEAAQSGDTQRAAQEASKFRQLELALKGMEAQLKELPAEPKPGPSDDVLNKQFADAQKALARAGEEGDVDAVERAVRRVERLRTEQPGLFTKQSAAATAAVDQQLADEIAAGRETEQARRQGVEQEVAAVRSLGQKEPGYAGEARKERQAQLEIEEIERGRLPTDVVEQGLLFPEETGAGIKQAEDTLLAKREKLVQQLAAARREGDRKAADAALEQMRSLKESEPQMLRDRMATLQTAYAKAKKDGRDTGPLSRAIAATQTALNRIAGEGMGTETAAEVAPVLAGTRRPDQLPAGAESVQAERRMALPAKERDVRDELERVDTPMARRLLDTPAIFAQPESLRDAAEYAHRARIGQESAEVEGRLQERLGMLERVTSETEGEQQALQTSIPGAGPEGVVFDTPEAFQKYLASDALAEIRKEAGLALQTLARAKAKVAPLEAQAADLRERVSVMQQLLEATRREWVRAAGAGMDRVVAAREKHEAALRNVQETQARLEKQLEPARKEVDAAQAALDKALAKQLQVEQRVAKHQASFAPDVNAQKATDAAVQALEKYNTAQQNRGNTPQYIEQLAQEAYQASVRQIQALRRKDAPLERSIVAFKQKEMELQRKLQEAQQAVTQQQARVEGAQASLDQATRSMRTSEEYIAEMRDARKQASTAQGVLTKAQNRFESEVRGKYPGVIEKQAKELQAIDDERQAVEERIKKDLEPERPTLEGPPRPPSRDTGTTRDAAENARLERLAAMPGVRVSYENYRQALDRLMKLPERIRDLDAKAKDQNASEDVRRNAKSEANAARNDAKLAYGVLSSDPEIRQKAGDALRETIAALETKVGEKKIAVNDTAAAPSTLASRRKELSQMQSKLREYRKLERQLGRRAEITPIGQEKPQERATEPGTRLPARKVGPVLRKATSPGNVRTGVLETQEERKVGVRKPIEQGGARRPVTPVQAVKAAQADTAAERALRNLADIEQQVEGVRNRLQTSEDSAEIRRLSAALKRLEKQEAAAQRIVDRDVGGAIEPTGEFVEDLSDLDDLDTPSVPRGATRTSTAMPDAVQVQVMRGDLRGALQALAKDASTPDMRALANKLLPLLGNTRLGVETGLQLDGKEVAGLYRPRDNTILMNPEGLFEQDFLHEGTHAATDVVLLADPKTLTPDQAAARRMLEGMYAAVKGNPAFQDESLPNVREFVAEVYTNPEFQAKLDAMGKPTSLLQRFWNAIRRMLGFPPKDPTQKAKDAIDRIMSPSRRMDAVATPSVKRAAPATAAEALADEIIARPQSFKERFSKNLGLSAEMWAVDMRAPLARALGAAGEKAAAQAMYLVRKADARMSQTYAALSNGALHVRKDDAGNMIVEAGGGPSAKDIFQAVSRMPGMDAQAKMDIAQVYLTAKRAQRVGWDKLDFDPERVGALQTRAETMMLEINADPAMKSALEDVSRLYGEYNKGLINFLAQTGAVPKAKAKELTKHGDYVPFYRVLGNGTAELVLGEGNVYNVGNIRNQPYLKELKGGDQKLLPLNEALVRNTMLLTDMGMRNLATKNVAYALQAIGKDVGVMKLRKGEGPADPNVVRFKQEPDPNDPKDDGERHLVIDTTNTAVEGIPADMLAQSLEGSFAVMPSFLKVAGWFGDILRSGVTRNPMYIARQLVRDPMAASFTAGLEPGPLTAVAKSMREFTRQMSDQSAVADTLLRKGVVQSQIFTGDPDDMAKFSLQLARGDQGAYHRFIAFWDRAAMRADAATRAQMYESAIKQGASEMEAEMQAMEMMNFNKRGISPTVQFASRMIPFFNAQIQGLNVLFKAATGKMPLNEKLRVKEKFYRRALTLAAFTIMYSALMEDDETYKNARPRDRYSNFILPNPLGGEHIKLPIPFEVGVLFKALPEAMMDVMRGGSTEQEMRAVRQMLVNQIPGASSYGVPQIARPALEVLSNANWFTGREIESPSDRRLDPQERFGQSTSEMAKDISRALSRQPIEGLRLSPKQIEHLVSGYLGSLPVAVARMVNSVFASEEVNATTPALRGSDLPVFGALFQRELGGGPVDAAYAQAQALERAANTFQKLIDEGRVAEAKEFRDNATTVVASPQLAKRFTTQMANFTRAEQAIRRTEKDPERMRQRITELDRQRTEFAKLYLQAVESLAR